MTYIGTFKLGDAVPVNFATQYRAVPASLYNADDHSQLADLEEWDAGAGSYRYLKLYKGASATETTGVDWLSGTVTDFDGKIGQHVVEIATGATDHAGFFAEDSYYRLMLTEIVIKNALGKTVDVNQWVGTFALRRPKVDIDKINGTAVPNTAGKLHVLDNDGGNAGAAAIAASPLNYLLDDIEALNISEVVHAGSVLAHMMAKDIEGVPSVASWSNDTNSLEALRDRMDTLVGTPAEGSVSHDIAAVLAKIVAPMPEIENADDIPATPTPQQAAMLAYMKLRNGEEETSTERRIINDVGTTVLIAGMSEDGTTFKPGKLGNP